MEQGGGKMSDELNDQEIDAMMEGLIRFNCGMRASAAALKEERKGNDEQ